jgi:hypothetical protein
MLTDEAICVYGHGGRIRRNRMTLKERDALKCVPLFFGARCIAIHPASKAWPTTPPNRLRRHAI